MDNTPLTPEERGLTKEVLEEMAQLKAVVSDPETKGAEYIAASGRFNALLSEHAASLIAGTMASMGESSPGYRFIFVPSGLNRSTKNLVANFARALAEKLYAAEKKYGYSDGWASGDWMDECRDKLIEHVQKGDPRDVAAYCAFLWHPGESTNRPMERKS